MHLHCDICLFVFVLSSIIYALLIIMVYIYACTCLELFVLLLLSSIAFESIPVLSVVVYYY